MIEVSPLTRLVRLVAMQYGVFHRDQARDLGVSDSRLHRLVRAGRIERVLPGVFKDAAVSMSLAQKMKAAELWAGPQGCLCSRSAAAWWGFDGIRSDGIEILSHKRLRGRAGITVHTTSDLSPTDVLVRRGLRVTTIERTLCDLSGRVPHHRFEAALHGVLRNGMTTAPRIAERLDRHGRRGHKGAGVLNDLLLEVREAMAFVGSRFEIIVEEILVKGNLPAPIRQFPVGNGVRTIHPDLAYPTARLAVEADSFSCHGSREAFYRDRDRDSFLRFVGWDILRFTWLDTKRPAEMVGMVGARLFPRLIV
ncbi:MAG: type IV toxin-antitoxin system AbiEi family antitoxin domain-containing protein [Actinomycetota bacterium]